MDGIVVVDRSEAMIGLLSWTEVYGRIVTVLRHLHSLVPSDSKTDSGRRFERLIEIAIHEWFESVSATAKEEFRKRDIDVIFVSGSGSERLLTKHW